MHRLEAENMPSVSTVKEIKSKQNFLQRLEHCLPSPSFGILTTGQGSQDALFQCRFWSLFLLYYWCGVHLASDSRQFAWRALA